ncbi:MAG: hypothetical protein QOC96_892 [Acidobacteriota bacterium]|jgi:hypothetical protein|nr:hypothetical protein [Acidobacteriota bacterium]
MFTGKVFLLWNYAGENVRALNHVEREILKDVTHSSVSLKIEGS